MKNHKNQHACLTKLPIMHPNVTTSTYYVFNFKECIKIQKRKKRKEKLLNLRSRGFSIECNIVEEA